jgi:CHRD domain
MKRLAFLLAAVVVFMPACDDDDPLDPSAVLPLRFTADLRASNEVPAVTNADSGATGTMNLTVTVTRDSASNVTAVTATEFVVVMAGFPAPTTLTGAHIHNAPAGQNAGIFINTGLGNGEVSLATGSGSFSKSPGGVSVENVQALVANPAGHYFNVHTQLNGGGAIRGQLVRVQ